MKFIDITGHTYGELTVIKRRPGNSKNKRAMWVCMCSCGKEHIVDSNRLRSGNTTSCGHLITHCLRGHLRIPENLYDNGGCKQCKKEKGNSLHKRDPEAHRIACQRWTDRTKLEALTHYGPGGKLGCCWEGCVVEDIDMLSLDHIKDDGNTHWQKTGAKYGGGALYTWARKNGWPKVLQTLCFNHQFKKRMNKVRADRLKPLGE
jgi:hypothetical protein